MRTVWILAVAIASVSQTSIAFPACSVGSLSDYIALGATGCSIGTDTLFDFATLSGVTGATPVSPASVSLTAFGSAASPGLNISVSVSAPAGALLESFFTYRISGVSFGNSAIELTQSSETGDGAVTGLQNVCANGSFGPDGVSGCTGVPASLITLDGIQNVDAATFSPASFLSVTDDLTIDGGLAGTAAAGTLVNRFNTVPEPGGILLTAAGLLVAVSFYRRPACCRCARNQEEGSPHASI